MEHGKSLKPLARLGVAHIDLCDCGMIYFGVGPVTVKLSKEAFEQVARGVRAAEQALNEPQASVGKHGTNLILLPARPVTQG